MIKFITFFKGKKIRWLDVGCGMGYLIKDAVEEGIDAYGLELSSYAIENSAMNDRILRGSIINIPYCGKIFDVVSAIDVIEHIDKKDAERTLLELYRILKPGGICILTTPNPAHQRDWIYDLTHVNVRKPEYWRRLLQKCGFKVKIAYIPSFIKYYLYTQFNVLLSIPDKIAFKLEELLRYIIGKIMLIKGRLYILAYKS
ncbi:MAG: class I SAM-dependent methyltransferase [Candidatus Odinarchaeum yellowstonii]|uniref:Class I SAM-dependent methyltransferase n=1 Tax=Odinarchaeota yellowstonii (strain LCB_4) TaxID=1841599 RepID=A0AAF0D2L1_ODILC|nr:MAG: class I SAM-dependent methyltransferase [Candidatus Odinarchaeum yellowstonii]